MKPVSVLAASLVVPGIVCHGIPRQHAPQRLTTSPADDRGPAWSPAGDQILFETNRNGNWDIYRLFADGSNLTPIVSSPSDERHPAWSPSGQRIVFSSTESDGSHRRVMNLQDSASVSIWHSRSASALFPSWSPDGESIVFTERKGDRRELRSLNLSLGMTENVLAPPSREIWPRYSPDGDWIAFFSRRDTDGTDDEIYIVRSGGDDMRRITRKAGHDFCPAWAPTGDMIVFASQTGDMDQVLLVSDLAGNQKATLGSGFHRVTEPSWSPDGRRIAYAGRDSGSYDIYVESAALRSSGWLASLRIEPNTLPAFAGVLLTSQIPRRIGINWYNPML